MVKRLLDSKMPVIGQRRIRVFIFFVLLLWGVLPAQAQPELSESELKALYIFNFSFFVDWPALCEQGTACGSFNICSLAENDVVNHLTALVENETIKSLPVKIIINPEVNQLSTCHIYYISKNNEFQWFAVHDKLKDFAVLTVSDIDQFIAKGGLIGFNSFNNKVVPVVNNTLAVKQGLTISSKLLQIANEVR